MHQSAQALPHLFGRRKKSINEVAECVPVGELVTSQSSRCGGFWRRWRDDDDAARRHAGLPRRRLHRHAQGFDGLAMLVQEKLRQNPFGGQIFVFRGRRGYLLKALWWDGQRLCLFAKRLPSAAHGRVMQTHSLRR
jgi:hypothetical protein